MKTNINSSAINSVSNNGLNISSSNSIRSFFNAIANNMGRLSNPLSQNKIAAAR